MNQETGKPVDVPHHTIHSLFYVLLFSTHSHTTSHICSYKHFKQINK